MLNLNHLPKNPGCYFFKDRQQNILYIGKAKNIQKRVKTYYTKKNLDLKTHNLLKTAESIDYIVTDNEVEALILENTLIKKHQPKYNISLKDAKTYAFIQLTEEQYPRLLVARNKKQPGRYYGPFVSASERDYILHFLRRAFGVRTCKKMPKKPCLRYHIQLCDAPCAGYISKQQYQINIAKTKLVMSGKTKKLIQRLKQEMKNESDIQHYEKAIKIRNQINALQHLDDRQNMLRQIRYDEDIINYKIKNEKVYLLLFNIYKGTLTNKSEFLFDKNEDFLEEFIVQYYSENPIPKEIITPHKITDTIPEFIKKQTRKKVKFTKPQKGSKKQLLDLVEKNIDITFFSDESKTEQLQKRLRLNDTPKVIECFDISHLSGKFTVGSMVQFRMGKPDKTNYRRFRIRTVKGVDDTKAISEVVKRRYMRLKKENQEYPDLIIIDGGKGQLNAALTELNKLELKIPIISLAKQYDEIYQPGFTTPLRLKKTDKALQFLQEIRDEAHRFALKYNRLLRQKEMIQ